MLKHQLKCRGSYPMKRNASQACGSQHVGLSAHAQHSQTFPCSGGGDDIAVVLQLVPAGSKGTALALDAALTGAATMVAPSIGSSLFQLIGFPSVGAVGSLSAFIMLCLVHLKILHC